MRNASFSMKKLRKKRFIGKNNFSFYNSFFMNKQLNKAENITIIGDIMMETKNVLISLDNDYFSGCIDELEDSLEEGWSVTEREYDECTNTSFLTLERELECA